MNPPDGYTTVSPYLIVPSAAEGIAFMQGVLGGAEVQRFMRDDGTIMHAEVRIGDSLIMIADAGPEWPATAAHLHIFVADVDHTYAQALAAGATAVMPPVQKENDDDKRGGVMDSTGTTWWLATRITP